jgi:hypothetical protein
MTSRATRSPLATLACLACLGFASCGPAPRVGGPQQASQVLEPTLGSIQANVLSPSCATSACHSGSPPHSAPVSLDPGRSWAETVEVGSSQAPLQLVNPGHPEASYLLLKVKGTAGNAGGISTRMPIGAPALTPEQIDAIETWIANGASDD